MHQCQLEGLQAYTMVAQVLLNKVTQKCPGCRRPMQRLFSDSSPSLWTHDETETLWKFLTLGHKSRSETPFATGGTPSALEDILCDSWWVWDPTWFNHSRSHNHLLNLVECLSLLGVGSGIIANLLMDIFDDLGVRKHQKKAFENLFCWLRLSKFIALVSKPNWGRNCKCKITGKKFVFGMRLNGNQVLPVKQQQVQRSLGQVLIWRQKLGIGIWWQIEFAQAACSLSQKVQNIEEQLLDKWFHVAVRALWHMTLGKLQVLANSLKRFRLQQDIDKSLELLLTQPLVVGQAHGFFKSIMWRLHITHCGCVRRPQRLPSKIQHPNWKPGTPRRTVQGQFQAPSLTAQIGPSLVVRIDCLSREFMQEKHSEAPPFGQLLMAAIMPTKPTACLHRCQFVACGLQMVHDVFKNLSQICLRSDLSVHVQPDQIRVLMKQLCVLKGGTLTS